MSSVFCSIDEAFSGPVVPMPPSKKKKTRSNRESSSVVEGFSNAPPQLSSNPMENMGELLQSAPPAAAPATKLESAAGGGDFFPLPGDTADTEEWAKAFSLQPSQLPAPKSGWTSYTTNGSINTNHGVVDGKSTLWRQAATESPIPSSTPLSDLVAPVPSEIHRRLEQLTRQIESLTTPTPLQSTAELFLFVAIGLILLLAIDTLLRFATSVISKGSARHISIPRIRGGGRFR
jgi:hypothetical protein